MDISNYLAIGGLIIGSGAIKIAIDTLKEIKDVIRVYKEDLADNNQIDNPELIIKELSEAIDDILKLQNIISKLWPKIKVKKDSAKSKKSIKQ